MAQVTGGTFARLQFTPDLVPADIVGTRIWRPSREEFDIEWGPVFANIVLADEINRAPAKVQSALLEVMAERQVSIGGHSRKIPSAVPGDGDTEPDRVRRRVRAPRGATRPLHDADHGQPPSYEEETEIARRMGVRPPEAEQVLTTEQLDRCCRPSSTTCSSTTPCRTTPSAWSWRPRDPPAGGCRARAARRTRAPAPGDARPAGGGTGARGAAGAAVPRAAGHLRRGARGAAATACCSPTTALAEGVRVDDIVGADPAHDPGPPRRSPSGRAGRAGPVAGPTRLRRTFGAPERNGHR